MVQATIPTDLDIYQYGSAPTELGDIQITGTFTEIDGCDIYTTWIVHQGAGINIEQETGDRMEGTGSVKVTVPAGVDAIIHAEFAAKDLSGQTNIKAFLKMGTNKNFNIRAYIGEDDTLGNWQDLGVKLTYYNQWTDQAWNISDIAIADKDAVIRFALRMINGTAKSHVFYVDYVRALKYGQIKAVVPEKVALMYPKIYNTSYIGNGGASRNIPIPRSGVPNIIIILNEVFSGVIYTSTMTYEGGLYCIDIRDGSVGYGDWITAVGDEYFTVSNNERVNYNLVVYHVIVGWAD